MENSVEKKIDKSLCTGCGVCGLSCPKNAIVMKPDTGGFLYPEVNPELCIDCGLCIKKCNVAGELEVYHEKQNGYAFKHYINGVRENSSSGGAFTLLSDYILSIDGVIYGAAYSDDCKSVHHIRANDIEGRNKIRGAKYVQSSMYEILPQVREDLENNKWVLFTGTPCQVAGVKKYLGKDYEKLLLCDILCHSVPSPQIFEDHVNLLEKKNKASVVEYTSREKRFGWTRRDCLYFENGTQDHSSMLSQLYYILFNMRIANRSSCAKCLYAGQLRTGDFTIGDFWGVKKPFKDGLGVSALLINSEKGRNAFEKMEKPGWFEDHEVSDLFEKNHKKPIKPHPNTQRFWKDYEEKGYSYIIRKYLGYSLKGKLVYHGKVFIRKVRKIKGGH